MVTMTVPGETEAGSAGMQPCRGITWRAHRDDDRSAEVPLLRSSKNQIGSVDPDASKIPARRAECSLTENARSPFHAEPGHTGFPALDSADKSGSWKVPSTWSNQPRSSSLSRTPGSALLGWLGCHQCAAVMLIMHHDIR